MLLHKRNMSYKHSWSWRLLKQGAVIAAAPTKHTAWTNLIETIFDTRSQLNSITTAAMGDHKLWERATMQISVGHYISLPKTLRHWVYESFHLYNVQREYNIRLITYTCYPTCWELRETTYEYISSNGDKIKFNSICLVQKKFNYICHNQYKSSPQ